MENEEKVTEEIEEKIRENFRMKGLILADIKVVKMLTEEERCDILKAHGFDEKKAIAKRVAILNKNHLTN